MLLARKRVLAAKIETTVGTAISLSGSDAAFNVFNTQIQPNIEFETREGQGGFSHLPGVPGARGGKITFRHEIVGDGAGGVPGWASTFLPACGWVNSTGTFSPKSEAPGSNVKTLTMAVYENGLIKKLAGCMGTFKFIGDAGKIAALEFEFTGKWVAPADTSILTPTYPTIKPMRFANTALSIASYHPKISNLTIDCGNQVILREDAEDDTGYIAALITGRRVTGSLDPEANLVATQDPYGQWIARTEQALAVVLDDGVDKITLAAPKLQFTNLQEGARNDNQIDQIDFQCNRSAAAGDDEFTITFAAHT